MILTPAEHAAVLAPLGDARPLPPRVYTDPDVFAWERDELLARSWLLLGHVGELAQPGRFACRAVGEDDIVLVRGEDGAVRAFHNVCQHRGSRLVLTKAGTVRRFRCSYHGWTYSLDGSLVDPADLCVGLEAVRCEERGGLVLCDLTGAAGDLDTWIGPVIPELLDRYGVAQLTHHHRESYDVDANWKIVVENWSECYHCPGVHPELDALTPATSGAPHPHQRRDGDGAAWTGGWMQLVPGACTLVDSDPDRPVGPPISGADRDRVNYAHIFPTGMLGLHPDYVLVIRLAPLAVDRTEVVFDWLAPAEADLERAIAFWDRVNREDWAVCERTQIGIRSRGFRGGVLTAAEADLHRVQVLVAEAYARRANGAAPGATPAA